MIIVLNMLSVLSRESFSPSYSVIIYLWFPEPNVRVQNKNRRIHVQSLLKLFVVIAKYNLKVTFSQAIELSFHLFR